MTYIYIPRDSIRPLLYEIDVYEEQLWGRGGTSFLRGDDRMPEGIDITTIGRVGVWENTRARMCTLKRCIGSTKHWQRNP